MDNPLFFEDADMDDPEQHFAWALSQLPALGKMQEFPILAPLRKHISAFLCALGFRHHPELQTLFKVRDVRTGRGRFVQKDELDSVPVKVEQDLWGLMGEVDASWVERVKNMSERERAEELERLRPDAVRSAEMLALLRGGGQ